MNGMHDNVNILYQTFNWLYFITFVSFILDKSSNFWMGREKQQISVHFGIWWFQIEHQPLFDRAWTRIFQRELMIHVGIYDWIAKIWIPFLIGATWFHHWWSVWTFLYAAQNIQNAVWSEFGAFVQFRWTFHFRHGCWFAFGWQ